MQTQLAKVQVHRYLVIGGDQNAGGRVLDLDVLTPQWDVVGFRFPEDNIAQLLG